ncbi:MAG: hypothetical protein FJ272_00720, partial [Planctomycetes bacterium]|nr:hypothetical protein [Planctomycetota bacterium]
MFATSSTAMLCLLVVCSAAMAQDAASWWNPKWRFRTTVTRPTPHRDAAPRPVEVAVDFLRLLERAGVSGQFDPASLRVVERGVEAPSVWRMDLDAETGRERGYLAWLSQPQIGQPTTADIYFDTKERGIPASGYSAEFLPPQNLAANPGFEDAASGLPVGWEVKPAALVQLGRFAHTSGQQSLKIVVDEKTPADADREVTLSQRLDVRKFAGQEMVFQCDLLAERAAYGAPVSIELQQFRSDGSRITEFAIDPR